MKALDQYVNLENAEAWAATNEKTIFFCNLTDLSAKNTGAQDYLESKFEELLGKEYTALYLAEKSA